MTLTRQSTDRVRLPPAFCLLQDPFSLVFIRRETAFVQTYL